MYSTLLLEFYCSNWNPSTVERDKTDHFMGGYSEMQRTEDRVVEDTYLH